MTDITPTESDLSRDLLADLEQCQRHYHPERAAAWGGAIRRALAAEAEVARLRATLAARDEAAMERDEHT